MPSIPPSFARANRDGRLPLAFLLFGLLLLAYGVRPNCAPNPRHHPRPEREACSGTSGSLDLSEL
jgi:hypothetical protein